ncbi:hypothetical protein [Endozoicomonas elysicola]|uniref:Uncharacterized protein n=1 Tax=Endozoicomonas elysicola TaxID=305900 RepID=A0A081K9F2_9GAMM|nr:hypothetical protein [Endozoicomonas elysicola]KEI70778.1 hypothetical protein GV64_08495 [Endozoicomonas elysicola]
MSDWDFLHDMHNEGYNPDQIADAAACGYNPYEPTTFVDYGFSPNEWEEVEDEEFLSDRLLINTELEEIFEKLVYNAKEFHLLTNRYLQIWGELGELFGEIYYNIKRHKAHTKGSDGKLGNDFIEIKTISPEKNVDEVRVKRAGNFSKLLIVKINNDFSFESQMIHRKNLSRGTGSHARAKWQKDKSAKNA